MNIFDYSLSEAVLVLALAVVALGVDEVGWYIGVRIWSWLDTSHP